MNLQIVYFAGLSLVAALAAACEESQPSCPAGQDYGCLGETRDTCFCSGPTCTDATIDEDCRPGQWCQSAAIGCVWPEEYCAALYAASPDNPYQPCLPYKPGGGGGTCTGEPSFCTSFLPNPQVTCANGGYQCAITNGGQQYICCPPTSRYYCGATARCYATIEDAAYACQCGGMTSSVGCVLCNEP